MNPNILNILDFINSVKMSKSSFDFALSLLRTLGKQSLLILLNLILWVNQIPLLNPWVKSLALPSKLDQVVVDSILLSFIDYFLYISLDCFFSIILRVHYFLSKKWLNLVDQIKDAKIDQILEVSFIMK